MKAKRELQTQIEELRRGSLLRAAARVIQEKGYHATSMDDIAAAAGLTKPGLYYSIRGKQHLLYEIMTYTLDLYEREVVTPARAVADAEQRIRGMIVNHVRLIAETENGAAITIVTEEIVGLTPQHRRTIQQRKRMYLEFIRDTFQQLKDEGKLKDLDPMAMAFAMQGMVLWLGYWFDPAGALSGVQMAEQYTEVLLHGTLKPVPYTQVRQTRLATRVRSARKTITNTNKK